MLNYHHLRYFWLVAHEGNLTRTAQKHNVAQSALSMQIHALEEYFGSALFVRQGRQLTLTEAGHVALEFADAIFTKGDELEGTMGILNMPRRQTLRVGALATLSRNLQIAFLRPVILDATHTMVLRSGSMDELLQDLENYKIDVILANVTPNRRDGALMVHTIAQQAVCLVGRPSAYRDQATLEELLRTELFVVPSRPSSIRTEFDVYVDRMQIQPQIVAEVDDMAMLRLVAREHQGLAVVPRIVVKDELANGVLVEVGQLPGVMETFYALTVPRRFPHPLLPQLLQQSMIA